MLFCFRPLDLFLELLDGAREGQACQGGPFLQGLITWFPLILAPTVPPFCTFPPRGDHFFKVPLNNLYSPSFSFSLSTIFPLCSFHFSPFFPIFFSPYFFPSSLSCSRSPCLSPIPPLYEVYGFLISPLLLSANWWKPSMTFSDWGLRLGLVMLYLSLCGKKFKTRK